MQSPAGASCIGCSHQPDLLLTLLPQGLLLFAAIAAIVQFAAKLQSALLSPIPVTLEDFESLQPVSTVDGHLHGTSCWAVGLACALSPLTCWLSGDQPLPLTYHTPFPPCTWQPKPPCIHDPATKSLSIVIPAYNEEARLGATLDETIRWEEDG